MSGLIKPVLLVNDTSHTNNPGCRGTCMGLRRGIRSASMEVVATLPTGKGARQFWGVYASPSLWKRARRRFGMHRASEDLNARYRSMSSINHYNLNSAELALHRELDSQINTSLLSAVVVNAEGTIHHNQPESLALYATITWAASKGLRVAVTNGTVEAMDRRCMAKVALSVQGWSVREPRSARYLRSLGIDVKLIPDALWMLKPRSPYRSQQGVGVTPGVLSGVIGESWPDRMRELFFSLKRNGEEVIFLIVEDEDILCIEAMAGLDFTTVDLRGKGPREVIHVIRNLRKLITGRYHMAIYSCLSGVPFVPLPSNTQKIAGLMELVGLSGRYEQLPDAETAIRDGGVLPEHTRILELHDKSKELGLWLSRSLRTAV